MRVQDLVVVELPLADADREDGIGGQWQVTEPGGGAQLVWLELILPMVRCTCKRKHKESCLHVQAVREFTNTDRTGGGNSRGAPPCVETRSGLP